MLAVNIKTAAAPPVEHLRGKTRTRISAVWFDEYRSATGLLNTDTADFAETDTCSCHDRHRVPRTLKEQKHARRLITLCEIVVRSRSSRIATRERFSDRRHSSATGSTRS